MGQLSLFSLDVRLVNGRIHGPLPPDAPVSEQQFPTPLPKANFL